MQVYRAALFNENVNVFFEPSNRVGGKPTDLKKKKKVGLSLQLEFC